MLEFSLQEASRLFLSDKITTTEILEEEVKIVGFTGKEALALIIREVWHHDGTMFTG